MSLHATARESNARDSVKKFFVDNLFRHPTSPTELTFDRGMAEPNVQGTNIIKWVAIQFGFMNMGDVSTWAIRLHLMTKKDNEGYQLAHLRDLVMGLLTDQTHNDGIRRIPFYKSQPAPKSWINTGVGMMAQIDSESAQYELSDETKVKTIDIILRWGTTI